MNEEQTKHLAAVPTSAVRIIERAYSRVGGRANAIKAMCLHCTGYSRRDVRDCTSTICPLAPWRPYQVKPGEAPPADDDDDLLALDAGAEDDDLLELPEDDDAETSEDDDDFLALPAGADDDEL